MNLKQAIVRLAHQEPTTRKHLLPLIRLGAHQFQKGRQPGHHFFLMPWDAIPGGQFKVEITPKSYSITASMPYWHVLSVDEGAESFTETFPLPVPLQSKTIEVMEKRVGDKKPKKYKVPGGRSPEQMSEIFALVNQNLADDLRKMAPKLSTFSRVRQDSQADTFRQELDKSKSYFEQAAQEGHELDIRGWREKAHKIIDLALHKAPALGRAFKSEWDKFDKSVRSQEATESELMVEVLHLWERYQNETQTRSTGLNGRHQDVHSMHDAYMTKLQELRKLDPERAHKVDLITKR